MSARPGPASERPDQASARSGPASARPGPAVTCRRSGPDGRAVPPAVPVAGAAAQTPDGCCAVPRLIPRCLSVRSSRADQYVSVFSSRRGRRNTGPYPPPARPRPRPRRSCQACGLRRGVSRRRRGGGVTSDSESLQARRRPGSGATDDRRRPEPASTRCDGGGGRFTGESMISPSSIDRSSPTGGTGERPLSPASHHGERLLPPAADSGERPLSPTFHSGERSLLLAVDS